MSVNEPDAKQWKKIGANAAKRGKALTTILTNNPKLDVLIREGYEAEAGKKAAASAKADARPRLLL